MENLENYHWIQGSRGRESPPPPTDCCICRWLRRGEELGREGGRGEGRIIRFQSGVVVLGSSTVLVSHSLPTLIKYIKIFILQN
jgi:hypothetical protein